MPILKYLYDLVIPEKLRFKIYGCRNPSEVEELRNAIFPSPKGSYSLKPYYDSNTIFVHITKSAGTSIAKSLYGSLPYHYTASQYQVIFGPKRFRKCFKYTFVRNPWDRIYSAFTYLKGGGWNEDDKKWAEDNLSGIDDFNVFILDWLTPKRLESHIHFWPQLKFLTDWKGKVLVDYIGHFETIELDFQAICLKTGLQGSLMHTNASNRNSYTDIYSEAAIAKVAYLYKKDIASFGYTFRSNPLHSPTEALDSVK